MHQHIHTIHAVGTPGAKYPNIAAAMAAPQIKIVGRLMRLSGLDAMAAPMSVHEIDAKFAASKALTTTERIELKAALASVGLMKS